MRLFLPLFVWPKNNPRGHIMIGRHRYVPAFKEDKLAILRRDIEREKTNALLCLHPAITKQQEDEIMKKVYDGADRPDRVWFQMRKAKIEQNDMAPVPLRPHYNSLKKNEKW